MHDLAEDADALTVDALLAHTCEYVDHAVELNELSYVGVKLTHKSEFGSALLALDCLSRQRTDIGR